MISATQWPLQDRVKFLPWISETFDYTKSDEGEGEGEGEVGRSLFGQQKFVRDYLQHASPYRGLYLQHTLGVGKTCAAIATAEALRPTATSVVVMTKKMLRANFASEVPSCTAPELLRNQPWKLVKVTKEEVDKVPAKMIRANGGVWVATGHGGIEGIPYEHLDATSQGQIDAQIDAIVAASFHFVHYNGLSQGKVDAMCAGPKNPFDGAVVIIDEVHNFISRAMNNRIVRPIYDRLLDAVGCKIVLLSGTPIVNRIAEIAYIVNLVQGKTIVHVLKLRSASSQDEVDATFSTFSDSTNIQSHVYDAEARVIEVVFAPNGFEMVPGEVGMVRLATTKEQGTNNNIQTIVNALNSRDIRVISTSIKTTLPLPDTVEAFDAHFVDWESSVLKNPMLLQRRMIGAISSYNLKSEVLFASVSPMNVVHADMSGLQFMKYTQLRYEERRRERNIQRLKARQPNRKSNSEDNLGQVYRTFSLALCTFAFPDEITRPFKFQMRARMREDNDDAEIDNDKITRDYEVQLDLATKKLKALMPECLRVDGQLANHSPKFMAMIGRLEAAPGPALVYSQFRRAEGIGLLSAALDVNGWREFRLVRQGQSWTYDGSQATTTTQQNISKKRYIVLRSEEDDECNRLLLNIFNNELGELPSATRDSLPSGLRSNLHGDLARVLMITASGAEGLSLKNVRQVHMLEGFWNHVRLDQVIGRAVRAKSHMGLPAAERHVDVFLYIANFTDEQRKDHAIMHMDKGLTSDQYVHGVAMKKKTLIDQALTLIKAASVDCRVHSTEANGANGANGATGEENKDMCFRLPGGMHADDRFRAFGFGDDLDDVAYARRTTKLVVVQIDAVKYYMDEKEGILYDYDKLKFENALVKVGQV